MAERTTALSAGALGVLATMLGATTLVTVAAGLAGSVPAWRAARLNPDITLRCE